MAHLWIRIHTIKSQGTIHMNTQNRFEELTTLFLINNGYITEERAKDAGGRVCSCCGKSELEQLCEEHMEHMLNDIIGVEAATRLMPWLENNTA